MAQRRHVLTRVSDETGAVLSGASAYVLRAGARVTQVQAISANSTATVKLRHPGALKLNDVVWVVRDDALEASTSLQYRVNSTPSYNSGVWDVTLLDLTGSDGGVNANDRLVLDYTDSDHYVTWYTDDTTTSGTSGALSVSTATGKVEFYVEEPDVDVAVVISGSATYFTDLVAGERPWVTPQEFGALADNSNDDTAAIQAAIDYVLSKDGGIVFFPAGLYKVSSGPIQITIANGTAAEQVTLQGVGKHESRILQTASGTENLIEIDGWRSAARSFAIKEMGFSLSSGTGKNAIDVKNASRGLIDDCYIFGFAGGAGVKMDAENSKNSDFNKITNTYIGGCQDGVWFDLSATSSSYCDAHFIQNCSIVSNSRYDIHCSNTGGLTGKANAHFIGDTWVQCLSTGTHGLYIDDDVSAVKVANCNFDGQPATTCITVGASSLYTLLANVAVDGGFTDNSGLAEFVNCRFTATGQTDIRDHVNSYRLNTGCKIISGSGSPEGSETAPVGSLYFRTDGSAGTTLYIKESGTGSTGWVANIAASGGTMTGDLDLNGNDITMGGGVLNMESGNITNVGSITGIGKHVNWTMLTRSVGTYYAGGFYEDAASANNFSVAQTLGTANSSYAAHVYFVATSGATDTQITVTGTSITDGGTRTASDTEVVSLSDGTASTYYETSKKWIGQVSISKTAGTNRSCNYGFVKYWDDFNTNFTLNDFEATFQGGANDSGFNIELIHHKSTGWTYNAGSAATKPTPLASLQTVHNTEYQLVNGEHGAFKVTGLAQAIAGSGGEGLIWRITTTAVNAVDYLNLEIEYEES